MTDRNKIVIEEAISKGHTIEFGTGEKFCISMFRVGQNGPEYLTYNPLPDVVRESMMEGLRKADANSQEPFDEARARAGDETVWVSAEEYERLHNYLGTVIITQFGILQVEHVGDSIGVKVKEYVYKIKPR